MQAAPTPTRVPTTVNEALEAVSDQIDQGYIFVQEDGSEIYHPFRDLVARARRRAGELQGLGLKKGDRLALVIPDAHEFVLSFLGALLAGVLPVPLYPPHSLGKLDNYLKTTTQILTASGASVLLATKQVQSWLWTVTDGARDLRTLTTVEKLIDGGPGAFKPVTVTPDDPAFIQFTSGSTADPKGVLVTHRSLVANSLGIMRDGIKAKPLVDKGISWLPLYHDMGLIGFVIAPIFTPVSVVFIPTLSFMKRPLTWLELMNKHRATITFAPNFAYSLVARRATEAHLERWDLSCLRVAGCGAEPISPATMQAFVDRFTPARLDPHCLLPCYGMAEATLAMSFKPIGTLWHTDVVDGVRFRAEGLALPPDQDCEDRLEFVSCGRPFPGHALRILDEDGQPLPERTVGEIEFSGPSVTSGYFRNPTATAESFLPEGLRTGDLGYMADGEIYVTGRKKDLIIINGRNYFPQTIEWLVEEVPGVRKGNVVAFSRPGTKDTEELVIVCEVRTEDREELHRAIAARIAEELGLPLGDLMFLEPGVLPKTTSGKVQRRMTRQKYAEGTLQTQGVRTPGQTGQALQATGHVLRAMVSRFRHTVRRKRGPDE